MLEILNLGIWFKLISVAREQHQLPSKMNLTLLLWNAERQSIISSSGLRSPQPQSISTLPEHGCYCSDNLAQNSKVRELFMHCGIVQGNKALKNYTVNQRPLRPCENSSHSSLCKVNV